MKDLKKKGGEKVLHPPSLLNILFTGEKKENVCRNIKIFLFFLFLTKEHGRKSDVETSGTTRAGRFLAIHTTRLIFSYQRLGGKAKFFSPF